MRWNKISKLFSKKSLIISGCALICAVMLLTLGTTGSEGDTEARLKEVLTSITGKENLKVIITTEENAKQAFSSFSDTDNGGKIKGAAVIFEDEISPETKKAVISSAAEILDVGSNHIFVYTSHIH